MASGIYKITNMVNGKFYIGSAVNLAGRKSSHFKDLRKGIHGNNILQRAFDKHGQEPFEWLILEIVEDKSKLIEREQHYIDTLNPEYNICRIAGSALGTKRTEETKKKFSEMRRGKPGRPLSLEACQKISAKAKLRFSNPAEREKQRLSSSGKKRTTESKARISAAKKGKTEPIQKGWVTRRKNICNKLESQPNLFSGRE